MPHGGPSAVLLAASALRPPARSPGTPEGSVRARPCQKLLWALPLGQVLAEARSCPAVTGDGSAVPEEGPSARRLPHCAQPMALQNTSYTLPGDLVERS